MSRLADSAGLKILQKKPLPSQSGRLNKLQTDRTFLEAESLSLLIRV